MKQLKRVGKLVFAMLVICLLAACSGGGGSGSSGGIGSGGSNTGGDTTPPTVVSTKPTANATNVAVSSTITATFSETIDPLSLTSASFFINGVAADLTSKCTSVCLDPSSDLSYDTSYTLTATGVKDTAGNAIATPYTSMFRTALPITAIAAADNYTIALKSDKSLWAWGYSIGYLITNANTTPTQVGTATNWSAISTGAELGLKSDGTLWTLGSNAWGYYFLPTQVGTDTNWSAIANGGATLALKTDGTLWAWGANSSGQLGDGTTVDKSSPIQIGTASNWITIAAGDRESIAIKSDGTLWHWGTFYSGANNILHTSTVLTPTQIGTATNWSAIAAGASHTLALKSDGTLWAWGTNTYAQLGDGTALNRATPIQIGTDTNWSAISTKRNFSLALKTDKSLWAWGLNSAGQLGNGTTSSNSAVPLRVGTATDWSSITAGSYHSLALKTDKSLWAWGANSSGQLGDGTTVDKTTPTKTNVTAGTLPSVPSGVTATGGDSQLTLSWSTVADATSYDIYYSTSSLVMSGTKVTCVTSPYVIPNLSAGVKYYAIVVASNCYGDSTASSIVNATTTAPPPPAGGGGGGGGGGGSSTYLWANWACTSSQCTSVMGASSGSTGPFCSSSDCSAWKSQYFAGAVCSTTSTHTRITGSMANGVCAKSGVDF